MPPVAWEICPGMRTEHSQMYNKEILHYCIHKQYLVVNHMLPGTDLVLKEGTKKLWPWM